MHRALWLIEEQALPKGSTRGFWFWGFFWFCFGFFFCFCLLVWGVGVVFCFKLTFGGGYKDGGRYGGPRK